MVRIKRKRTKSLYTTVLVPSFLLQLPHRPERSHCEHRTHNKNKHRHNRKETACNVRTVELTLEALVTFTFVHLLSLLTDGIIVCFLQLNKVEGHPRNVAQCYQGIKQSLPQQHRGATVRDPENPQSEHGTGVDHQEPAADHSEDVRRPLELVKEAVQLHHPVSISSGEGPGATEVIMVESAQAGQVTVTAVVAVRHSSADDDEKIHKHLHQLAETWET